MIHFWYGFHPSPLINEWENIADKTKFTLIKDYLIETKTTTKTKIIIPVKHIKIEYIIFCLWMMNDFKQQQQEEK